MVDLKDVFRRRRVFLQISEQAKIRIGWQTIYVRARVRAKKLRVTIQYEM